MRPLPLVGVVRCPGRCSARRRWDSRRSHGCSETGTKSTVRAEPVRLQIALPQKPPLQLTGALALSPDGRQLAFVGKRRRRHTSHLSSSHGFARNSRRCRARNPQSSLLFWKPDGRFIAFDSGGKLRKIDISGGPAEVVCSLNLTGIGGSWNADGDIIFGQYGGPIMRVSAAGGVATPITVLDAAHGDVAHTEPQFLPDGRHFIYMRDRSTDIAISAGSLDVKPEEQDSRRLVQANLGGAYAPSSDPGFGQMLFLRGQTLMAQPFDARHLKISGDPVRVVGRTGGRVLGHRRILGFRQRNAGLLVSRKRGKPAHLVRRAR